VVNHSTHDFKQPVNGNDNIIAALFANRRSVFFGDQHTPTQAKQPFLCRHGGTDYRPEKGHRSQILKNLRRNQFPFRNLLEKALGYCVESFYQEVCLFDGCELACMNPGIFSER